MRSLLFFLLVNSLVLVGCTDPACPAGSVAMEGRCVTPVDGDVDAASDAATPDASTPDGAVPDGAVPDGAVPDGATPDAGDMDSAVPDGGPACDAGFADCDGVAANGCEVDLNADDANCGMCDNVCTDLVCAAGTCRDVVEDLVAGWRHVCALTHTGRVFCWGDNIVGQLGDGTMATSSLPVEVPGLTDVVQIAAGGFGFNASLGTTCALERSGRLYCWGSGAGGQVGDGAGVDRPSPVLVSGGISGGIVEIAAGPTSCARTASRTFCWGSGAGFMPLLMDLDPQLSSISTGLDLSCGVGTDQRGYCWGGNMSGAVGDGTTMGPRAQTAIVLSEDLRTVGAGTGHGCALTLLGRVYCWGSNLLGSLGLGTAAGESQPTPTMVPGQDHVTELFVHHAATCTVQDDSLWCWGSDAARAAREETALRPSPERVAGIGAARRVAPIGSTNICVLTQDYRVLCWGVNAEGELGNGSFESSDVPVEVMGLP